jgi:hypothetical protein
VGEGVVRVMFVLCLLVIAGGLAYCITLGVLHR